MSRTFILKLLLITMIIFVAILLIFTICLTQNFYDSIFRLSSEQISSFLAPTQPKCKNITECNLLPGDILIRRYITQRTWLFDKIANPYFTHSAFYLGNDKIVEAVGTEDHPEDDIQIEVFSKSDWFDNGIDFVIIIRPKNYSWKLDNIKNNLINIANDPDYTFGISKKYNKKTSCADIIFNQLLKEDMIQTSNIPKIITPDYLFWVAKNDKTNFEIIGYNLS